MKRRIMAFLMCLIMLLAGLPMSPVAEYTDFAVSAFAAGQSFRVSISPVNIFVGRQGTLVPVATYDGEVITDGVTYTWQSDDTSVATVDSSGIVTGVSEGETDIIVTASYSGETITIYRSVTVQAYKPVTSVTPTVTEAIELTVGEGAELKVKVLPTTATVKELNWTSSNSSGVEILTTGVDEDESTAYANIQALSQGTYTVNFSTTDGTLKSGSFTVIVKPRISSLTLPSSVVLTTSSTNQRIVPVIYPSNAGNQVLNWSSTNNTVCTVSYLGYLTPIGAGTCYINASTTDGSNITRSTFVVVSDGTTSISLDKTSLSMKVGEEDIDLTATCTTPSFSYEDAVTWSSSNTSVATVDSLGLVTAVGPGTATITATTSDGTKLSSSCSVSVTQPLTGISLPSELTCWLGGIATLNPVFVPSNATNKDVTWSSSDPSVAEISSSGIVTGKSVGETVITVTAADGGFTASCTVKVEVKPTGVTLSDSALTLKVGDSSNSSGTLTATVYPSNATNKSVTWSSSNTAVATVNSSGQVTAVAGGTAVITCTTVSGNVSAICNVTVYEDETGIQITNIPSSDLYVGENYSLTAVVSPSTATNKNIVWSSSNTGVIYIDQSGKITARAVGSSVITATTANKGIKATCTIFVVEKIDVTGITLNRSTATVKNGEKVYLIATVTPSNASNKAVVWTSSNTAVATVDNFGTVTTLSSGAAQITATTLDKNITASCTVTVTEPVTGVNLNKSKTTIGVGLTESLQAIISPSNATNKKVTWTSSNTEVATVSSNGLVTAKKAGTTVVMAITEDGGYTSACTVTVVIPVESVKINASSLTVPKGETRVVTKTITPSNATNQSVTWSSSNVTVATVSAAGLIKGIRTGTATITVTTDDGKYQAHIDVKVIQPVTALSLTYSSISLDAGKKKTISATVRPLTASDKTVSWKSSDTKIATVDKAGNVKAVSAGTATITCTTNDGYCTATCKVTVTQPATGISFPKKKVNVSIGTPKTLTPTILPENASNKNVTWKSADTKIASVDEKGVVTGHKKGTVKITATTANGLYSATVTVNVLKPVKKVVLNKTSVTIAVGKSTVITATVKPKSASNKNVIWKSSDNDVLTVSSTGKITAKSAGYAVVTCTTEDGEKKAECTVFVNQPVKSLKLNKKSATLDIDSKLTLKATLKPSTASNKGLKWTSSNNKVAKVTAKGVVKPVSPGTAVITVTTIDGGFKATCRVTVVRKVKSVELPDTLTVFLGEKGSLDAVLTPANPTNSNVTWTSSKKKTATVSKKGVITPKKLGTTVITVKTEDGGLTDTCKVTVKRAIKSLSLNKKNITLNNGVSYTLKAVKKPANATEKITWKSSNKAVAVVSQNGVVTAKGRGTATITAVTEKGISVKCKVTVLQPVTSMNISKTAASVYMGESLTLSANVLPSNANNQTFSWSSSNTAVAVVSGGKITPKSVGTAVITVKSANGKTASCTVTVKQHVSSVSLDKSSVRLLKGDTQQLTVTVLPTNASEKGLSFTCSDSSVATVSASGLITAVAPGTAIITVTSKENNKTATCKVTVVQKVQSVSLDTTVKTLYVDKDGIGESFRLTATVAPSNATDKSVTWTSSDSSVAAVSSDGTVTAKKSGVTVITVKANDEGKLARCTVTVLQHASGIELESSIVVNRGAEHRLDFTVLPSDAYNKNINWVTAHEDIALVNEYGIVTGVNVGTTVITATTVDGSFSASCTVKVNEPVTGVSLDRNEVEALYKGESLTLTATVEPDFVPDEVINKQVVWTSSDESIATVDENGVVTAVDEGQAVITVTTVDGSYTDSCSVTCLIAVEEIITDSDEYYITVGSALTVEAQVLPENASRPEVSWEIVAGGEYFTLENGTVTATEKGNGLIRITSTDNPSVTKDIEIHVVKSVESVSFNETAKTMYKGQTYTLVPNVQPGDAYDKSVSFASDDENVVTVDENGLVTAVGRGTATVTVTTTDGGFTAECSFTVIQLVEQVVFTQSEYNVGVGKSLTLTPSVLPENANNKSIVWTSSSGSVATVNDGVITANSVGEAIITATANTGYTDAEEIVAQVKITVTRHAEEIILESTKDVLWVGETANLTATVMPEDTTDKTVTYTSSDESIATVDENGVVTAVGASETGTANVTIRAVSACTSAESEYVFTVKQQVTDIQFSQEIIILSLGDTYTLAPEVLPENAFDKTLTFTADSSDIIEIDGSTIRAVGIGTVTVTAVSACGNTERQCSIEVVVLPDTIEMETEISVEKETTYTLNPVLKPDNVTETEITFSSSDESVATVDSEGTVSALKAGTTVITAQTQVEGVFAQCLVTVYVNSEEINLNLSEHTFYKDETLSLIAEVLPSDTTNKNVTFSSGDESVATVDENGTVTAVDAGTTEIIVTAEDTGISAVCRVTVLRHVEGISFSADEYIAYVGRNIELGIDFTPSNASNKNIIWKVNDTRVADVDGEGKLTALSQGTVVVTAESEDGSYKAMCLVEVRTGIDSVSVERESILLDKGASETLAAVISPENATVKKVIWTSSDESIATVDENGVVTAKNISGQAVIRATAVDNSEAYGECTVTVKEPLASIFTNNENIELRKERTAEITVIYYPTDATVKDVTFSSDDEGVATVDENGLVTAVGPGTAVITVTSVDGGHTAQCTVKVYLEIEEITAENFILNNGTSAPAPVSASPTNHDETLIYSSSNEAVATIDEDGVITALSPGVTNITVTGSISGTSHTFRVTVKQPVTGVSFNNTSESINKNGTGLLYYNILPSDADNIISTEFSTSDETVAKILGAEGENSVRIQGIKAGEAVITVTVTTEDGVFTGECVLTVTQS